MKKKSKIYLLSFSLLLLGFLLIKTMCLTGLIYESVLIQTIEYFFLILFTPIFYFLYKDYNGCQIDEYSTYERKLIELLIEQVHNETFYKGDLKNSAKDLTKQVTEAMDVDRCSLWLFSENRDSIICEKLYTKSNYTWVEGIELHKKDFKPYFDRLEKDPIIVASNALTHPSTSCFKDNYLDPLGIKSMLDVPIMYRGNTIGVICIESLVKRHWLDIEINFSQLLSSLYSFSHSINQTNLIYKELNDFENFVDNSVLVSRADSNGKITYVNEKFCEVSGWDKYDAIGKDHNIVNSGYHTKDFWKDMYDTVIRKKRIWNKVVTNKNKNGELYWVDSFIKANFDDNGELKDFTSIRYDVSKIVRQSMEIEKKNTYLEHAAKILRHDMHSGINTYIPRGISSLERRLNSETIENLKLESPLKMIKEGLTHTQKVYKGVYEFTNLVKKDTKLTKTFVELKNILDNYLSSTSYKSQVFIDDLGFCMVNESLFCTAIDNLIRNGLKYNDSDNKVVKIYKEGNLLHILDNGRGMTQEEFNHLSKPYTRKEGQKESGTGLGLNICVAILQEHGFQITCDKNDIGTKLTIHLK